MNKASKCFVFLSAVLLGMAFHASFLFFLQNSSFTPSFFHNKMAQDNLSRELLRQRNQIVAEIFEHFLAESAPEIKASFHELAGEYAPSLELAFPEMLPSEPFAFEQDHLDWESSIEGEVIFWEASDLVSPSLPGGIGESPTLSSIYLDGDPCENFESLVGSEHFDIQVEYAPKRSRPGYVFKIIFVPRPSATFQRIRQNYYFLLDRSNSIPRARYFLNKKAVARALEYLQPGDTFNILIFDDSVARLAPACIPWNETSLQEAKQFLEQHGHGGLFAATELYASLGKIIPADVPDTEVNTAILLSDGDTYLSTDKQRQTIGKWTARNQGKVSLFSVASGTGNNLALLELLSAFNKGHLVYAQEHAQTEERLVKLIQSIQNPIGKKMTMTGVCPDKQMTVILHPKKARLPDLYQNRLFTVYGSTNKLSDFYLFLQGQYYDRRFDIKKKITFAQAKVGSPAIERQWTQLLVQDFYEHYFEDGNFAHLEAAKQLLIPLNLPVPLLDKQ